MEIQYLLESLGFYLLPSLLVALIPTAIIVSITLMVKSSSNWLPVFLSSMAGVIMWCDMAYWGTQGFTILPFGTGTPLLVANLFALIGGILGGAFVYRGTAKYKKNKSLSSASLIGLGYLVFVFIAFSILNNRWVA
jgi:hypothetical protein